MWRASSIASAVPKCTDAGVCHPMPEWRWTWFVLVEEPVQVYVRITKGGKRFGEVVDVFQGLKLGLAVGVVVGCSRAGVPSSMNRG